MHSRGADGSALPCPLRRSWVRFTTSNAANPTANCSHCRFFVLQISGAADCLRCRSLALQIFRAPDFSPQISRAAVFSRCRLPALQVSRAAGLSPQISRAADFSQQISGVTVFSRFRFLAADFSRCRFLALHCAGLSPCTALSVSPPAHNPDSSVCSLSVRIDSTVSGGGRVV